jgi:hypothetical protein
MATETKVQCVFCQYEYDQDPPDTFTIWAHIKDCPRATEATQLAVAREALGRVEHLRATLLRSDSMLSLLRHRCAQTIPWGALGMPDTQDIDEIIGASREALRATGPY